MKKVDLLRLQIKYAEALSDAAIEQVEKLKREYAEELQKSGADPRLDVPNTFRPSDTSFGW